MADNLSVRITADVVDLQAKFAVAKSESAALTAELNRLAREARGGMTDELKAKLTSAAEAMLVAKAKAADLSAELRALTPAVTELSSASSIAKEMLSGFGVALSAGAVVEAGRSIFETAAGLETLASETGTSIEGFQALRNVMTDSGVSSDEATTAMTRLNRAIGEAEIGNKPALEAFSQLGLTLGNLSGGPEAVMPMVAQGLLDIQDSSQRAQIETVLFGRAGQELENALQQLVSPTSDLIEKQQALGRIMGSDVAEGAHKAETAINQLAERMDVWAGNTAYDIGAGVSEMFADIGQNIRDIYNDPAFAGVKSLIDTITGGSAKNDAVTQALERMHGGMAASPIPSGIGITPENQSLVAAGIPSSVNVTSNAVAAAQEIYTAEDKFASDSAAAWNRAYQQQAEDAQGTADKIQDLWNANSQKEAEDAQATTDKISELWDSYYAKQADDAQATDDEIQQLWDRYYQKQAEDQQKSSEASKAAMREIGNAEDSLIQDLRTKHQSIGTDLEQVFTKFAVSELQNGVKSLTTEGLAAAFPSVFGDDTDKGGGVLVPAITALGTALGLNTAALTSNTSSLLSEAASAIGGGVSSVGSSLLGGISAVGSFLGFAAGTNNVPNDMLAVVHAGERIIPSADNRAIVNALSGGGGGRGDVHVHLNYGDLNAGSQMDFPAMLQGHARELAGIFRGLMRNGAFR